MREPKPQWVEALQRLTGNPTDTIRFNEQVHRWEFIMAGADGRPRGQFWGHFDQPKDQTTGLHPFRELDDDGMREALRNLERTFIGNPYDGHGTTTRHVTRMMEYNRDLRHSKYQAAGELFADMWADRIGHREGDVFVGQAGGGSVTNKGGVTVAQSFGKGSKS